MRKAQAQYSPLRYVLRFLAFILLFALLTVLLRSLFVHFLTGARGFPQNLSLSVYEENGERENKRRIVVLDAGHGGEDGGTSSIDGTVEKDLNLALTMLLKDQLNAVGITVVLTRDSDRLLYDPSSDYHGRKKVLDQRERLRIAESTAAENRDAEVLFVSIHMNSYPNSKVRGLHVWYSENHASSARLADSIQRSAVTLLGSRHEKTPKEAGSSIFLLDRLEIPAVLIECGFLSSPEDTAELRDEEYRRTLAFAICTAILNYEVSEKGSTEVR